MHVCSDWDSACLLFIFPFIIFFLSEKMTSMDILSSHQTSEEEEENEDLFSPSNSNQKAKQGLQSLFVTISTNVKSKQHSNESLTYQVTQTQFFFNFPSFPLLINYLKYITKMAHCTLECTCIIYRRFSCRYRISLL